MGLRLQQHWYKKVHKNFLIARGDPKSTKGKTRHEINSFQRKLKSNSKNPSRTHKNLSNQHARGEANLIQKRQSLKIVREKRFFPFFLEWIDRVGGKTKIIVKLFFFHFPR